MAHTHSVRRPAGSRMPKDGPNIPAPIDYDNLIAHPLADEYPMADEHELKGLKESIKKHGILPDFKIKLYEGGTLDGRNRHKAAKAVGYKFTATDFSDFKGTSMKLRRVRRPLEQGHEGTPCPRLRPRIRTPTASPRANLADAVYPGRERRPTHQDISQDVLAISSREWLLADQTSAGPDCSRVAIDPIEPVARLTLRTGEVVGVLGLDQTHDHDGAPPRRRDPDVGGGTSGSR